MSSQDQKSVLDVEKTAQKYSSSDSIESDDVIVRQIDEESDLEVRYRTCSWQKTAALLFSEYICLAVLSFPWSYSVLGLVPGILVTVGVALICLYTSLVLGRYCLKYPELRDICDIGRKLFGGSVVAYNITCVFFILNNTFIQALHVLVGAKLLNTLSDSSRCTVVFGVVSAIICFMFTLPRTLSQLSYIGIFSAVTMGLAVLLAIIFAGVQSHPAEYISGAEPIVTAFPVAGTNYVSGMSAFLNITYTFVGQAAIPSFIAEMRNPKEFPKALWAVTIAEIITFTLCGALMYRFVGNQYMTAPAFGSLQPVLKKIAFSFALPTIVFLGALYSSVTARFIFFRLFKGSKHLNGNSVVAWSTWTGIIAATWVLAFIIAQVIPFFSDMLSLMSSLFDGWFGFIFWAMAYLHLNPGKAKWNGTLKSLETLLNYFFILLGVYVLVAGTYTSIQSIIDSYAANHSFPGVALCDNPNTPSPSRGGLHTVRNTSSDGSPLPDAASGKKSPSAARCVEGKC
ncbi:putative transmembrane amino acid transporter protein [Lyophyllum shimeji]|uniref:Transmembrane amino acid transporter protein n=1 Tax=Lyophyllum shimeji TaxID=47721 RepID=A0A9P3PVB0_LYOSH|nr:putative transmembrane amino acid transporter protein [Lyophyllum shimeji]